MMVTIDKNKAFEGAKKDRLIEACGLIPYFFVAAKEQGAKTAEEAYQTMVDEYGFGDYSGTNWGTVDPKGTYVSAYDEDPDMEPLMSMSILDGPTLHIYQSAILAVVDANKTIISRMD